MRFLKWTLGVLLVVIVCGAGFYLYLARDVGPTHDGLKNAKLPPIIPFHEFYADMRAEWIYRISPNGDKVAWHAAGFGTVNVKVADLDDLSNPTLIEIGSLDDMQWHPDGKRVVVYIGGRAWAIDPAQSGRDDWDDITPRGFDIWWIAKPAHSADDRAVITTNSRVAQVYDLFTVDAEGRDKQPLIENSGDVALWGLTSKGDVVLRIRKDSEDSFLLEMRESADGDNWLPTLRYSQRETFHPVLMPGLGEPFYAISNRGRDLAALVKIDLSTGAEEVIAAFEGSDVTNAVTLYLDSDMPDLVSAATADEFMRPLSDIGRQLIEAITVPDKKLVDFDITALSQATRKISFRTSYDGKMWQNSLFDPEDGSVSTLGQGRFSRHNDILAKSEMVRFDARDGLSIPAILTKPVIEGEAAPLPTIIEIHGGPASFDSVEYDGETQFLTNRGYVVLSVNFRGSTGFGKAFRAAGYGETGGKMQDDIVDAAKWLIAQGIADPDNIAVMGASYGGYSAALAMTRDDGVFKAGIVDVAVTDIPYQMTNNPYAWGLHLDEMVRYFGDPDNKDDLAKMRDISPITHAAKAHGPILIAHGKLDNIVGFEQTENFVEALETADKDVDVLYFENEGHGYYRWQSKVVYWRRLEKFLAQQLGGRDGGFDYVELGPKIFGD